MNIMKLTKGLLICMIAAAILSPRPGQAEPTYATYFRNLTDFPADCETGWTEHPQGLTHDLDHWYFTKESQIYRIPVGLPLNDVTTAKPGVNMVSLYSPSLVSLVAAGFSHFGDPDFREVGGVGYLLVPLEGTTTQAIGVFRADSTLALVTWTPIAQAHAAWCAVDAQGYLYSANDYYDVTQITKYPVDWSQLGGTIPKLPIDETGKTIITLSTKIDTGLQGGEVTADGQLIYLSIHGDYSSFGGIRAYRLSDGALVRESTNGEGWFNFEVHEGSLEVTEGLTLWDLDDGRAPGISGQLHAIMFYDDPIGADNAYLKHYDSSVFVDGAAGEDSDNGPGSTFKTVGFASAFAWSGAKLRIKAGSYPETLTINKPQILSGYGGEVTIGK